MTLAGASAQDSGWALTSVTNGVSPSQLIKQQQNCIAKACACLAPSAGTIWPLHEGNLTGTFHPQRPVRGLSVFRPLHFGVLRVLLFSTAQENYKKPWSWHSAGGITARGGALALVMCWPSPMYFLGAVSQPEPWPVPGAPGMWGHSGLCLPVSVAPEDISVPRLSSAATLRTVGLCSPASPIPVPGPPK